MWSIEKDIKGFRLIKFLLNEILQMSKFKFFLSQNTFSRIPWNLQMLSISEKLKNWKSLLKNSWKIGMSLGGQS